MSKESARQGLRETASDAKSEVDTKVHKILEGTKDPTLMAYHSKVGTELYKKLLKTNPHFKKAFASISTNALQIQSGFHTFLKANGGENLPSNTNQSVLFKKIQQIKYATSLIVARLKSTTQIIYNQMQSLANASIPESYDDAWNNAEFKQWKGTMWNKMNASTIDSYFIHDVDLHKTPGNRRFQFRKHLHLKLSALYKKHIQTLDRKTAQRLSKNPNKLAALLIKIKVQMDKEMAKSADKYKIVFKRRLGIRVTQSGKIIQETNAPDSNKTS